MDFFVFVMGFLISWIVFTIEARTIQKICLTAVNFITCLGILFIAVIPLRLLLFQLCYSIFHAYRVSIHLVHMWYHDYQHRHLLSQNMNMSSFPVNISTGDHAQHFFKARCHDDQADQHFSKFFYHLIKALKQMCELSLQLLKVIPPACYFVLYLLESIFFFVLSSVNPVKASMKGLNDESPSESIHERSECLINHG